VAKGTWGKNGKEHKAEHRTPIEEDCTHKKKKGAGRSHVTVYFSVYQVGDNEGKKGREKDTVNGPGT